LARTIKPRDFRAIEFNQAIINLQTSERRHDVLDQFDLHALMSNHCAALFRNNKINPSWNRCRTGTVHSLKRNAVINRSRPKPQTDIGPRKKTDSGGFDIMSNRVLRANSHAQLPPA
jgi:hypothetical protein